MPHSHTAACWHWPGSGPILAHDPAEKIPRRSVLTPHLLHHSVFSGKKVKAAVINQPVNQSITQYVSLVLEACLPPQRVGGDCRSGLQNKLVGLGSSKAMQRFVGRKVLSFSKAWYKVNSNSLETLHLHLNDFTWSVSFQSQQGSSIQQIYVVWHVEF